MSRERDIFAAAVEIADPAQRDAYLAKACGGDPAIRERVDDLLEFEREDHSFLTEQQIVSTSPQTESLIGTQIGRYKLLEEIGEGGCGIVYMAEQREPVRRKVALKVIKPGMDTREVIARFDAERQALAMMDHPHIARVLDGGETEHGRPYFVMELVNGVPITEYCDANRLTPEQRLKLFIKVCHAVQHAHQKGIIHRDIKPSNVLVTLHDGEAVPRVIDFGVAKAIGQQLTDDTLFTRFGQVVGTPQYMSPEQAERSGLDVDTRSDIYSLGVLLYELLTGQTPLDKARLKQAAFDELLRVIREEEPQPPSSRISTLGEAGTIVCESRSTEAQRLERMLRGDLDWIVMKALEKDRTRRFETAGDLVADIQRHLKNEPVLSGPPTSAYRVTKFVQRNRIGVLAAAAVIGALAVGLGSALVGLSRANTERNNAIASAEEAQTVLTMLREMLATDPDAGRGRDLTVRKMLDDFSASLPDLSDQPQIAAEIHSILGRSYKGLDFPKQALGHLQRAYDLKSEIYGEPNADLAHAASQVSHMYHVMNGRPKAYEYGKVSVAIYDALGDFSEKSLGPRSAFCQLLTTMGEPERAETILRRAIRQVGSKEMSPGANELQDALAGSLSKQGKHDEAISIASNCMEFTLTRPESDDADKGWAHFTYGQCLQVAGRLEEAASHFKQALDLFQLNHGKTTIPYVSTMIGLARTYGKLFRYDDAIALLEDPLAIESRLDAASTFNQLVLLELDQGNYVAAEQRCTEALERMGDAADMIYPRTVARFLMAFSQRRRSPEVCQNLCDEMLSEARVLAEQRPGTFSFLYSWVLLHKSNRTADEAEDALRFAKEAINASGAQYLHAMAHYNLSLAYLATSDANAALEQQRLALMKMPKHRLYLRGEIEQAMANQLESAGRIHELREFLDDGVRWREVLVPTGQIHTADSRMRLADFLIKHSKGKQDLETAEKLLLHESHVPAMKMRAADDLFRTRWIELLIHLYDAWEKPDEKVRWERFGQ